MVTLALMILSYWLPTLLAFHRHHRNRTAILLVNLFLGWTVIGWVVSLIWACTSNCELYPSSQIQARGY